MKFKPGIPAARQVLVKKLAGEQSTERTIGRKGRGDIQVIRLRPDVTVDEALEELNRRPEVLCAQPDYVEHADDTPGDPSFPLQWGLNNDGQVIDGTAGTPDADIDAPEAWEIERGDSNPVTVAVIDSGIDVGHPDLQNRIWANADEIPANGLDDDNNGYVDDIAGYNWAGISQYNYKYWMNQWVYSYQLMGRNPENQKWVQSFTARAQPGHTQRVTHVGIMLKKSGNPTEPITVSLRDAPDGTVLGALTIAPQEVSDATIAEVFRQLDTPADLPAGTTFYLQFETTNQNAVNFYLLYDNIGSAAGTWHTYREGQEYSWDGAQWDGASNPNDDFYFRTNGYYYPYDNCGHGTHCSGIIAAESNDQGVAGIAFGAGARIMPLKAGDCSGSLYQSHQIEAIYYAIDNGADVISMSFGGTNNSPLRAQALEEAYQAGLVLFASAGNSGGVTMQYPAGNERVIGVGATTNRDERAAFSTYNASVDLSAPGAAIYSTMPTYPVGLSSRGYDQSYDLMSGTSMACPMAAGLAALALSARPDRTPSQLQSAMEYNSADLGVPGRDDQFGHGRIDAWSTLRNLGPPVITSVSPGTRPEGCTLVVRGEGFAARQGSSLVRFGGTEANELLGWSETELTVKIPGGVAGGGLVVETYAGQSEVFDYRVGYPVPVVAAVSPPEVLNENQVLTLELSGSEFIEGAGAKLERGGYVPVPLERVEVRSIDHLSGALDLRGVAAGRWSVTVEYPDGTSGTLQDGLSVTETEPEPEPEPPPPPPSAGQSTWYLAEGTTAWGFSTYITIENPNAAAVEATVTYMPKGAGNVSETLNLPANSQTTITNDHILGLLGEKDFSTEVEATDKTKAIAVDRTMEWTGGAGASGKGSYPEGHSSVGVTSPATTWYLPEGSTNWNFETWLLIQNPSGTEASCDVTYMIEGQGPQTVNHKVPANSRESFSMQTDIGAKDASIKVVSDQPVIPERAMYRYNRREGHDSIGTTTPASDFYLAEGAVGYDSGYITYVLVQNPQGSPTDVTVTYLTGSGQVAGPSFQMPANSRKTVKVNDTLPPATDVSTSVHGSAPIIAERAMYWNSPAGEACHDSIGMSTPAMTFYLPDGQTSQGRETWTLVQNPNGTDVEVTITYLTAGGGTPVSFTETIPANSRKTFNMADKGVSGRAAILVQSKPGGRPIMCERAMYWSSRSAGTDTIGGSSD